MKPACHILLLACLVAVPASAQAPLQLAALQREAQTADPRARELDLQHAQTALRIRNIEVERLPALSALGQAQYQSDVPTSPFTGPTGQPLFSAPNATYDASLRVDQRLFDPSLKPRIAVARADLAESEARIRATLFGLRHEVNDAFFTAALLQEEAGALAATIADLETRLRETSARVREGTALAGEAAAVEATLLQHRQQEEELRANRRAALARLSALTGHAINADAVLALPDSGDAVARARTALEGVRARPEYEQFARARDKAVRQQDLAAAADRPRASAFGRVGYGKPGLNFIADRFETYGLAGLQLQWNAWTWGTSRRERDALGLQQQIVSAEETAFTDGLRRAIETNLASIDRLESTLAIDERIIALRQGIDRGAQARFREGVVTASEYLDRNTEWLGAQFARARHRVELAFARTRLLTTLGLEVP